MLEDTEDEGIRMQVRVQLIPYDYASKEFSLKTTGVEYERRGEMMLAREYYEMDAWMNKDMESREWVLKYDEARLKSNPLGWMNLRGWRRLTQLRETLGFPEGDPVKNIV